MCTAARRSVHQDPCPLQTVNNCTGSPEQREEAEVVGREFQRPHRTVLDPPMAPLHRINFPISQGFSSKGILTLLGRKGWTGGHCHLQLQDF